MSDRQQDLPVPHLHPTAAHPHAPSPAPAPSAAHPPPPDPDLFRSVSAGPGPAAARVTAAGADWLASASSFPRSVQALWRLRPGAPSVLPCGTVFDVVSVSPVFGRRLLDRLWTAGPVPGPTALHRGRLLLFTVPGTAQRLPALLGWEEWLGDAVGSGTVPQLLCHGRGDAVTVPALYPAAPPPAPAPAPEARPARQPEPARRPEPEPEASPWPRPGPLPGPASASRPPQGPTAAAAPGTTTAADSRWLVAPGVRHPWLPGPDVLLWACVRTLRAFRAGGSVGRCEQSIFVRRDRDAKVYDVSRRR